MWVHIRLFSSDLHHLLSVDCHVSLLLSSLLRLLLRLLDLVLIIIVVDFVVIVVGGRLLNSIARTVMLLILSVLLKLGWCHDLVVARWARVSRIEAIGDARVVSRGSLEKIVVASVKA
jgi:hypothetical protein